MVHTIFPASPTAAVLRAAGIPVHRDIDRAGAVLAGIAALPLPSYADEGPGPAEPLIDSSYDGARRLFSDAGIAFPAPAPSVTATSSPRRSPRLGSRWC